MRNMDDLLNEGFNLKAGDLFEILILQGVANSLLLKEILKKQIEVRAILNEKEFDDQKILNEVEEIVKLISEEATRQKDEIIAKLYLSE